MLVGYAPSGQSCDFVAYDASGNVWNGSSFVTWVDGNFTSLYRITATEVGTTGRFTGTTPSGTTAYELRLHGASLAASPVMWTEGSVMVSSGTGTGQLDVTSGVVSADAKKINGVSTSPVTTVGAFIGNATAALAVDVSGRVPIGALGSDAASVSRLAGMANDYFGGHLGADIALSSASLAVVAALLAKSNRNFKRIVYVRTDGDDVAGDGSIGAPYATPYRASINLAGDGYEATEGDLVDIGAGTYTGAAARFDRRVTVCGQGWATIIYAAQAINSVGAQISGGDNCVFEDFAVISNAASGTSTALVGFNGNINVGEVNEQSPSTNVICRRLLLIGDSDGDYFRGKDHTAFSGTWTFEDCTELTKFDATTILLTGTAAEDQATTFAVIHRRCRLASTGPSTVNPTTSPVRTVTGSVGRQICVDCTIYGQDGGSGGTHAVRTNGCVIELHRCNVYSSASSSPYDLYVGTVTTTDAQTLTGSIIEYGCHFDPNKIGGTTANLTRRSLPDVATQASVDAISASEGNASETSVQKVLRIVQAQTK